jgi:RNA polymerase sigma-70 factor (ECF subfamily)
MSEPSDQQLLSAWAKRHDEAAFRSLLGRYAGFVYGATLRRVGDAGLAEEIAQDVFARLSQNAGRLLEHPTIAGWLHRSAMLLALDRLRRRTRQARTLERFAQMNETTSAYNPWADAHPHLDEALDCLSAPEREVLMLHFAERRTFPEIAKRLGSTSDAVRMRTNRALASLSRMLEKKGTVIPATVLATGLSGTFAQAAPASLMAITPAALAGLGKVSAVSVVVHAIQTTRTAKAIVGAAVAITVSLPLAWQQNQIATTQAQLATLQARAAMPVLSSSQAAKMATGTAAVESTALDLKSLAEDALANEYFATRRVRKAIARLDNNNLTGLIETAMHSGLMPDPREQLLWMLVVELKKRDPALFLEWTVKVIAGTRPAQGGSELSGLLMDAMVVFSEWVAAQPGQAAAWVEANKEEWRQFPGVNFSALTIGGLLQADPPRAYAMLEKSPVAECMEALTYGPKLSAEQTAALAKWAASSVTDEKKRRKLVHKALGITPREPEASRLETIRPTFVGLSLNDDDLTWVAVRLAFDTVFTIETDLTKVPATEIAWLEHLLPADRIVYAQGAFGHAYEPAQALIFLNGEFDKQPNDDLIAGYVESEDMRWHNGTHSLNGGRHGETAFRLATRVQDAQRRATLLAQAWKDLHDDSAQAAQEILAVPELDPNDRVALEAQAAAASKKKP